MMITLKINFL